MTGLLIGASLSYFPLALDLKVVEAVEGGPVTVDVSAKWTGTEPLRTWYSSPAASLSVGIDRSIPHYLRPEPLRMGGYSAGGHAEPLTIKPGDVFTKRIYLHIDFVAPFMPGELPLVVRLGPLSKAVTIRVVPFTKQFADAVYADCVRKLRESPLSVQDRGRIKSDHPLTDLVRRFMHSSRPEFISTAFLLLQHRTGTWDFALRQYLWRVCPADTVHEWLIKQIESRSRTEAIGWAFEEWRVMWNWRSVMLACARDIVDYRKTLTPIAYGSLRVLHSNWEHRVASLRKLNRQLPDKYLMRLVMNPDIWVQVQVYLTFGDRLSAVWRDGVVERIRERYSDMPASTFKRLVADLDDDDFQVREAASAALAANAYRLGKELPEAVPRAVSPEARRRLRSVAEISRRGQQPAGEKELLFHLELHPDPAARRLLETIADGEGHIQTVVLARRIRDRGTARP